MTPLVIAGWIALGVCLPFVAAAALLGVLAGRFAWERRREDRAERARAVAVPPELFTRLACALDDNLAHLPELTDEDIERFWRQEGAGA